MPVNILVVGACGTGKTKFIKRCLNIEVDNKYEYDNNNNKKSEYEGLNIKFIETNDFEVGESYLDKNIDGIFITCHTDLYSNVAVTDWKESLHNLKVPKILLLFEYHELIQAPIDRINLSNYNGPIAALLMDIIHVIRSDYAIPDSRKALSHMLQLILNNQ